MPDWKKHLEQHLSLPRMKGDRDERMVAELSDHLDDIYNDALEDGATEAEARGYVEDWLGDTDLAAEELIQSEPARFSTRMGRWAESREERLRDRGGSRTLLADFLRDIRLGIRALARRPVFSGIVILVLALGIGVSTTLFSLVNSIVLAPLPFEDAGRLVAIGHSSLELDFDSAGQTPATHFTYEEENGTFQSVGLYGYGLSTVTGTGPPEAVPALFTSSGTLRAIRMNPVIGRSLIPADEDPAEPAVVLLTDRYWRNRFGNDPQVLGKTLQVDGGSLEIVGVVSSVVSALGQEVSLVIPTRFNRANLFVGNFGYQSVARLRDGVTAEQAGADLDRMWPLAFERFPGRVGMDTSTKANFKPGLRPLKQHLVGAVANLLWILLGGVGVVFLIACANVANLFLVCAEGREVEMAVRRAMGADGPRIGWEYLKESLVLGVLGGAAGVGLAYGGLRLLIASGPDRLPRLGEVSIDAPVLGFALFISLAAGTFLGLIPILRHRRRGLLDTLRQGSSGGLSGRRAHRVQGALVVGQMALTLLLLIASGLMMRSLDSLRRVDPGFRDADEVLALRLFIPSNEIEDIEQTALTFETIARRLAEIPEVDSVALSNAIPMDGTRNFNSLYIRGDVPPEEQIKPMQRHKWIGEGYLETLRIRLLAGRDLTWHDVHGRLPVVMVSERLALEFFGSIEAALGQQVSVRPDPVRWYEVVGVVADVREDGLGQDPIVAVYWPQVTLAFWEGTPADQVQTWRDMGLAIRSSRVGTAGFLQDVQQAIWDVNPNLPPLQLRTLGELMSASMARTSFTLTLLGISSAVALILGIVGLYGVISYAVSRRTRELGLRMALGAQRHHVTTMVLRQAFFLSSAGVAIGLALAFFVTDLMGGLLFGVSPVDPPTFVTIGVGLTLVALVASYIPAARAADVDPMSALRAE